MIKAIVFFSLLAAALGANCTYYCDTMATSCTAGNEQWADLTSCMDVCPSFTLGADGATAGNTLACRIYHAEVAGGSAALALTHCPHAGPGGNGTCGTVCEGFCSIVQWGCNGTNAAYSSDASCQSICATYDKSGVDGATSGASFQCRMYHAQAAITTGAKSVHCPHASPSGGPGACGSMEENYCQIVQGACTGTNSQYTSMTECADYTNTLGKIPEGDSADTSGNTVGCRLYHAGVAATPANAAVHCPHAGKSGDNTCGTWCQVYCQLAEDNCVGANELFATNAACMTACANFPATGALNADAGDSVQCRIYHAGVAGTNAAAATTHCPHADVDGGGVCIVPVAATTGSSADSGAVQMTVSFAIFALAAVALL